MWTPYTIIRVNLLHVFPANFRNHNIHDWSKVPNLHHLQMEILSPDLLINLQEIHVVQEEEVQVVLY